MLPSTTMRRGLMLLIALVVPGCLQDATQTCADGTLCPDGFVCLAAGGCVSTVQQAACDGLVDGDRCAYAGVASGTCAGGACVAASCGNLIVDELEGCDEGDANANTPDASCRTDCQPPRCGDAIVDALAGELCDDGNRTPGDGCDFDCGSLEVCGNDRVDFAAGEL